MLDKLKAPAGANQKKTRRGRGEGSGLGRTSGRGGKGQTARTGGNIKPGFEGGQMPMQRRIPKRGFTNAFGIKSRIINLETIDKAFNAGETVDEASILAKGLLKKKTGPLKVLGEGEITKALTVKANKFSKSAIEKIKTAGGKAEVI